MAMIPKQPSSITFLLFALLTLSFTTTSSAASDSVGTKAISVYWGQQSEQYEEGLQTLCSSTNYDIVILKSLLVYDNGSTPQLNLEEHCGTNGKPCSKLQWDIEHCQALKVKVLLSIGQDTSLTRKPENNHFDSELTPAQHLANYLWDNFLNGQSGPLGSVSLDGIDIAHVADGVNLKWSEVVRAINALSTTRKIYLSAAPQCVYPDPQLGNAINTGLLDYIWVEFFHNNPSCIYSNRNATNLLNAWNTWTSNVPNSSIFLGLTAYDNIEGYMTPETVINEVLPKAKNALSYGGVMIWDRGPDIGINYSGRIRPYLSKYRCCVCDGHDTFASKSFNGVRSESMPLSI